MHLVSPVTQTIVRFRCSVDIKSKTDVSMEVDHLFWFGDMNYRIDLDYRPGWRNATAQLRSIAHSCCFSGVKPEKPIPDSDDFFEEFAMVNRKIKKAAWNDLLEYDQVPNSSLIFICGSSKISFLSIHARTLPPQCCPHPPLCQLTRQHEEGNVLSGFELCPVNFAPTVSLMRQNGLCRPQHL